MLGSTSPFAAPLGSAVELARRLGCAARDAEEAQVLTELLGVVRRFCAKHVDSAAIDARGALGSELLDAARQLGWFGLTVPEAYGGAGLSLQAATRVVAELTSYNGSLGTCVGLHSGLALYSLIHLANRGLQQRYLPEIARGQRIAAFAATEPAAGSDLTAMRTTLAEQQGGLRLSGSKCYVTNGGVCGLVTVVARSPGLGGARAGHTMVAVDPAWPGVVRQREEHKLGLKGSSTISMDFEDVQIPPDHVVGQMSQGMEHAHRALTWGRTFMAAGCLGVARSALEQARAYTAQRVQFGRPLAQLPLVRDQTAGALADTYAADSVIRLVCALHDAGLSGIELESVIAKLYASEAAWLVADRCLQLMGGAGYIEDTGMARRLRDVRVTRIFEGANDVLRLHLASSVLGWKGEELSGAPPLLPHAPPALHDAADRFDQLIGQLMVRLAAIRSTLAFRLFNKQPLQVLMADAIIAVYVMLAVLLRTSGSLGSERDGAAGRALGLGLLACRRLETRARRALEELSEPEDPHIDRLVTTALAE